MALLLAITFIQVRGTKPPATLKDHPIAAGEPIYLDGAWTLASSALEDTPSPPSCTKTTGCCFQNGIDWKPASGPNSGHPIPAASAAACCAACTAYGERSYNDGCYVAVFLINGGRKQCWFKSRQDAAGGSYSRPEDGRVSCMPKTKPLPPLPPPPPPHNIVGTVPGDLISDLEAAGLVGDPYFEVNWLNSSLWATNVWTYSTTFQTNNGKAVAGGTAAATWLVFDGIKMGAMIYVDGALSCDCCNSWTLMQHSISVFSAVALCCSIYTDVH